MKKAQIGLLCLALSVFAGQAMAKDKDKDKDWDEDRYEQPHASVPEPSSIALLGAGLLIIACVRRSQK